MKELIFKQHDQILYLEPVTSNVERIRTYLKDNLKDFSLYTGDESLVLNFKKGDYLNLNEFLGFSFDEDEIKLRKKLLDLLKLFKNMFKELFFIETIEAKKISEVETYSLILLDDELVSYEVVTLTLEDNHITFRFDNLYEIIYNLLLYRKGNQVAFDSSYEKIALSLIQKNKNNVLQHAKQVKETLSNYNVAIFDSDNYLEFEEFALKNHIPLVIEIGPSNVRKNELTLISKFGKKQINKDNLIEEVELIKKQINEDYYKQSFKNVLAYQKKCLKLEDLEKGNRFCSCLSPDCLKEVQNKNQSKTFYHTFSNVRFSKKCLVCGKEARDIIFSR